MKTGSFFSLIRWPNLVIIILSMVLIRQAVIFPILGIDGGLSTSGFLTLVFAVIFITTGGYLINDYFDMDTDRINKPGKNLVGTLFSVELVKNLYYLFSAIGIGLGMLVSWWIDEINYSLIFLFTVGILWYYSERYQCQVILGNVVVAFLSALSFGLVWIFDFFALKNQAELFSAAQSNFGLVSKLVLLYMGFAFITSLFREMVKDMEDIEGDKRMGCRTLPVVVGVAKAKRFVLGVGIVLLAFVIWVQYFLFTSGFIYVAAYFILVDLLTIIIILKLIKSDDVNGFHKVSTYTKLLMLVGILSMVMFLF